MKQYSVVIAWSCDDGGYIATVPRLPGCSAFGETRAEAAVEIEHAIEAWCAAAWKAGNAVPAPDFLPTR